MTEKGLREKPIVITIDLTEELFNMRARGAWFTETVPKVDQDPAINMKNLKREPFQIPLPNDRNTQTN